MRLTRLALAALATCLAAPSLAETPRLFVLTDIGNEPDDKMSLVRLLVYANVIDIEGLIATTSTWQRTAIHPETIHELVAAYGQVRANLLKHAPGWPEATALDGVVATGRPAYGMKALEGGALSSGAAALIKAGDAADARPLWVSVWGGANVLAEALSQVRETRSPDQLAAFVGKLRVSAISDQDDAGPWIRREFPGLFYIVKPSPPDGAEYASATWTGISGDRFYRSGEGADFTTVTNEWLDTNIRSKGPLGKHYPRYMFIMEGDTPSFLGLISNGLASSERPNWGGWGGRYLLRQPYGETRAIWTQGGDSFRRVTSADTVDGHASDQATIWRWRTAFQNDFAARMDWTIRDFADANHPPLVSAKAERTTLNVGESVRIDANQSSDPDHDRLTYRWFHYAEAGVGDGNLSDIRISGGNTPRATVTATAVCRPNWLPLGHCAGNGAAHVILAVTDNGKPALTRYARVILTIQPKGQK